MNEILIEGSDLIIASIVVLFVGGLLTERIAFLKKYSIPQAVTGGLIFSFIVLFLAKWGGVKVSFDLRMRDVLLLTFFSTIGLTAKFSRLKSGGKPLGILVGCAAVFLVVQNLTGVLLALGLGSHPGYGLFAGSVSFAGGHGTAIAWGQEADAAGLLNAGEIGIAFATFGLIAGGVIGGPITEFFIKKYQLTPSSGTDSSLSGKGNQVQSTLKPVTLHRTLVTLFILAVCVSLGDVVNRFFFSAGVKLPGFLTSMMVGILITNFSDAVKRPVSLHDFDKVGEVALQLFLAMSLMSMDLNSLASALNTIMFVVFVQVVVISLFATFVVFRVMGKDYDAAVICGGFIGLGLGATPVAIANMSAVTSKYGPSFKAFLIVPLVGAFFVDLLNALIIKFFIGLPIMQNTPLPGG
ncbi:MAG TPA: sodium/glutamate symporter [Verrucomicrobiales bacterium]|nr:sodium/glutamate symporter [Verrucomicrobiales bacterium]HIL71449.1 sodium/glutamate symporter [Verrucomicrobiota bacterium]